MKIIPVFSVCIGLTLPEDEQPTNMLESDKILSEVAASVCKVG